MSTELPDYLLRWSYLESISILSTPLLADVLLNPKSRSTRRCWTAHSA